MEWNRAHQTNQRQEAYQHQIPRNGRETGYCFRVGDTIWWGRCSLERDAEEVGEEGMTQEV